MNLMENLVFDSENEIVELIMKNDHMKIERITSSGQKTEELVQDEDEFIYLAQGEAYLSVLGKEVHLKTHDTYFIPRKMKHQVTYTSDDCVWLCVYFGNFKGY